MRDTYFSKYAIILLLLLLSGVDFAVLHAQNDEEDVKVTIEITEEESLDSADLAIDQAYSFKEKYEYLIRAYREEKGMVKLSLVRIPHLLPSLGYEGKVSTSFSLLGEVGPMAGTYRIGTSENQRTIFGVVGFNMLVGGRYYYNLNKRIRKKRGSDNFSANYISASFESRYYTRLEGTVDAFGDPVSIDPLKRQIAFTYGIQRRLGDIGYIDFYTGMGGFLGDDGAPLLLKLGLQIGLGF